MSEDIRPSYYGGKNNPFEPIKIIQWYKLCWELGNSVKYILRAGIKDPNKEIEDLIKARTSINMRIDYLQAKKDLTINIKCEDNLSPVLEEMWDKVLDIKKEITEDEKMKWHNDVSPKLISELKVGDEIKAVNECYRALIKNKMYPIIRLEKDSDGIFITIKSELYKEHTFDINTLHKYFHVIK